MSDSVQPTLDRPVIGMPVEVVGVQGSPQAVSRVENSLDHELVLAIGIDANGRRVRLGLGAEVLVWWAPDGITRYRPYEVADVRGGEFPTWLLRPAGPCSEGDRRSSPRVDLVVPVGLITPIGMVLGESTDMSEGGVRAIFTAAPTAGFGDVVQPFPEVGELALLAVVLGGSRVELRSRVLQTQRMPDGRRLLRAAFEEMPEEVRIRLRATTSQEIGRQLASGRY